MGIRDTHFRGAFFHLTPAGRTAIEHVGCWMGCVLLESNRHRTQIHVEMQYLISFRLLRNITFWKFFPRTGSSFRAYNFCVLRY